jgi:hypothetical protein
MVAKPSSLIFKKIAYDFKLKANQIVMSGKIFSQKILEQKKPNDPLHQKNQKMS